MNYTPAPWHFKKSHNGWDFFIIAHSERRKDDTKRVIGRPDIVTVYKGPTLVQLHDGERTEAIARVHQDPSYQVSRDENGKIAEMNARLIAHAPDMFEWLETFIEQDDACDPVSTNGWKRLRKLMDEIRGGPRER